MVWQIEYERLIDGAILTIKSPIDKDSAIRTAYALIDLGHDVRHVLAPDGTKVGAATIAEAYLNRHRAWAAAPAASRIPPAPAVDENPRPTDLRGLSPSAEVGTRTG